MTTTIRPGVVTRAQTILRASAPVPADNAVMARKLGAWQWVDGYLIEAFGADAIDNAVWAELVADIASRRTMMQGVLVLPGSAVPNARQRAQLTDALGGAPVRAAVLSTSAFVRTALTAINYFVRGQARAFAPDQLDAALSFLAVPQDQRPRILQAMEILKNEIGRT